MINVDKLTYITLRSKGQTEHLYTICKSDYNLLQRLEWTLFNNSKLRRCNESVRNET